MDQNKTLTLEMGYATDSEIRLFEATQGRLPELVDNEADFEDFYGKTIEEFHSEKVEGEY